MADLRVMLPALALVGCVPASMTASEEPVAAAAPQRSELEIALDGLTPGPGKRCIDRMDYDQTRSFDGVIFYVGGPARLYRNDVTGFCPGLADGDVIITRSTGNQQCRGDIVQTRSRSGGMVTGSCTLGDFVPYTRAAP